MQSFPFCLSQPEPENHCPDCLYLKLEGAATQANYEECFEFCLLLNRGQQAELHLTLNFGEQWESLGAGRVKFGLRGGELRLKLENGDIPYECRELDGYLELSLPDIEGDEQDSKTQTVQDLGKNGSQATQVEQNGSNRMGSRTQRRISIAEQFHVTICQVTTRISGENPAWIFEEEMGEPVLRGSVQKTKLATLEILDLPCRVEATFEVTKRDICLTEAQGVWPPDLSRNKRAVLDRLIIQRLLEPKFEPYLSRAELHYD